MTKSLYSQAPAPAIDASASHSDAASAAQSLRPVHCRLARSRLRIRGQIQLIQLSSASHLRDLGSQRLGDQRRDGSLRRQTHNSGDDPRG